MKPTKPLQSTNAALRYLETRRKTFTAPSGISYTVRRVPLEQMLDAGSFPAAFVEARVAGDKKATDAMIERDARLRKVIMTSLICAGVVGPFRVVSDPPQNVDAAANCVSIDDIEPEDQLELVNEISALNGLTQEAAAAAKPFPEEQAPTEGA